MTATPQATRVAELLRPLPSWPGREVGNVSSALQALASMLDAETRLEADTITLLVNHDRYWSIRTADEETAYCEFWSQLARRHPAPQVRGKYADVLSYRADRRCEALTIFMDAVKDEPPIFVKYAGEFFDLATECGPKSELEFELAKIRFYTYLVARDELEPEELQEAVHEVLDRFGTDPSVRPQLWGIAREFLGADFG